MRELTAHFSSSETAPSPRASAPTAKKPGSRGEIPAATPQSSSPGTPAERIVGPVIFTAQKVITMEPDQPEATAVGIADGRIVAVGSLDDVQGAMSGSRPYSIDRTFEDKIMMPGLIEHHLHPMLGVLSMAVEIIAIDDWTFPGKSYTAVPDEAGYRARLRSALDAMSNAPADETLFTWGYHHYFHGKIYRTELDAIESQRPIVTWHRSCHEFIFNSAALKKYGLTEASWQGHGLASEQSDFAQGHVYEKGMELAIPAFAKDLMSPKRVALGLANFKSYVLSKGITTICEPGTQMLRKFQAFWEEHLNTDDVAFRTYFVADGRTLFEQHKAAGTLGELLTDTESYWSWGRGKVQWLPKQIKLFCDGAIFSQLMQVQQPYLDGHQGQWIAEPVDYDAAFKAYWDAGYRIHTHVNGDEGLAVVIAALQERMAANPRKDHRFTVVHFAVSTEEQVAQLAALGATITANPYYVTALADKYSEVGLGPERANAMVRLGSVAKTTMPISLHSDMPMAPADPLFLAWCAVNRTTVSGRVAAPEQRLGLDRALHAITIDSAGVLGKQDDIGSIKPGKKADFTILEQDPTTTPVAQLKDIPIWGTVLEGRKNPIHTEAPAASGAAANGLTSHAQEFAAGAATRG